MTEPGSGRDNSDNVTDINPKLSRDPITSELSTAAEFFKSPDRGERILAAEAITRALELGVENPQEGIRLSKLLRVRAIAEALGLTQDTGLHRADEQVKRSIERLRDLTGSIHEVFIDLDPDGYISQVNDAITPITGLEAKDLVDINLSQIVNSEDAEKVTNALKGAKDGVIEPIDFRIDDVQGRTKWVSATSSMLRDDGEPCGFIVTLRDITNEKELQMQIEAKNDELARKNAELAEINAILTDENKHDALTGLYNQPRAKQELEMLRKEGRRMGKYPVSILYIDADNFKQINDTQGHEAGNEALQTIARLISCGKSREEDFVARYGGDEFVFIMQQTANEVAQNVVERINNAFLGHNIQSDEYLSVSIGLQTAKNSKSINATFQGAEESMYGKKRDKKEGVK